MNRIALLLLGFSIFGWCPVANAACAEPKNKEFATVATALFNCSSARPLNGAEQEGKFQIHYDFPQTAPDSSSFPWLTIDPLTDPATYMHAILLYLYAIGANVELDTVGHKQYTISDTGHLTGPGGGSFKSDNTVFMLMRNTAA